MSSYSLFLASPLKLHLPQISPLRWRSPRIAAVPVFSSPSSHGTLEAKPSFNSFSPISCVPQTPAAESAASDRDMSLAASDVQGRLLLEGRIIFLTGTIDDALAHSIINQLFILDCQDHTKDIRLFICSSAGSLSAAMAIYDVVQFVRADVSTIAIGIVAPPASIILCGGAKGKRLSWRSTRMLIAPIRGASDVDDFQAREIIRMVGNDKQQYISATEAFERGIIDKVIDVFDHSV